MGIDFTHTDAHWSYMSFARFRKAVAAHEGINLGEMAGFRTGGTPWDGITSELRAFLNHSDCDGELSPEECRTIAPALRKAIEFIWPAAEQGLEASLHRENGLLLVAGMESAAAAGETFEFC